MHIVPASPLQFDQALDLLVRNNLPVADLSSGSQLFVAEENNQVLGTIAIEYDYRDALLRSLSVAAEKRGAGLGARLVQFIEDYVRQQGVDHIYLLTTTAAAFFKNRNYVEIDRTTVPEFIRQTTEFNSLCPASATVMKKSLTAE